jgi:hypothetical protein
MKDSLIVKPPKQAGECGDEQWPKLKSQNENTMFHRPSEPWIRVLFVKQKTLVEDKMNIKRVRCINLNWKLNMEC